MESKWIEESEPVIEDMSAMRRQDQSQVKGLQRTLVGLLVGVGLLAGGFYLGTNFQLIWPGQWPYLPEVVSRASSNAIASDPLFNQVRQLMHTKYLRADELDDRQMLYGAIAGMVSSAGDPYTSFFDPEANKASEEQLSGQFSGVGMELGYNADQQIAVVAPIADTPAARAGVMSGDILLTVDGTSIKGLNLQQVVNKIRGEEGTEVVLTMQRGTESSPREFKITRQQITIKSVELEFRDGGVAYVQLSRFGETTKTEWDQAVSQIISGGSSSMILDMRNNPGGYLDTAIYIGSEFFDQGMIVGQQDASGKIVRYDVNGRSRLTDIQVTVLINGGSASASEIVAGALKARERATVVGQTSFGKGSVQQVVDLPGNTSLHVTVARWVLPDDSNIDGEGIEPDVEVELTSEDVEAERDPQLDKAMELARK